MVKSRRFASACQSSVKATSARRPSVLTSRRNVVTCIACSPATRVTVPWLIPVGTALIPAAFAAAMVASGASVVATSTSPALRPAKASRTAPPTTLARPPARSMAANTPERPAFRRHAAPASDGRGAGFIGLSSVAGSLPGWQRPTGNDTAIFHPGRLINDFGAGPLQ